MQLKAAAQSERAEVNPSGVARVERMMQNYEEKGRARATGGNLYLFGDERSDFPVKGLEHRREEKVAENISEAEKNVSIH